MSGQGLKCPQSAGKGGPEAEVVAGPGSSRIPLRLLPLSQFIPAGAAFLPVATPFSWALGQKAHFPQGPTPPPAMTSWPCPVPHPYPYWRLSGGWLSPTAQSMAQPAVSRTGWEVKPYITQISQIPGISKIPCGRQPADCSQQLHPVVGSIW